jgi:hypothetical protein
LSNIVKFTTDTGGGGQNAQNAVYFNIKEEKVGRYG